MAISNELAPTLYQCSLASGELCNVQVTLLLTAIVDKFSTAGSFVTW